MKKNKKIDKNKLDEFFEETDKKVQLREGAKFDNEEIIKKKTYICPKCHGKLDNRIDACPHCGYKGYIPMSNEEIKKTRLILFFVILAIAIIIFIFT